MQNPFIIGEKIYLRPIEMADADAFISWLNDAEVRQFLSRSFPINAIREKEFVEGLYKDQTKVVLAIVIKESDQLIGVTGLHAIDSVNRKAIFGIFVGDKKNWSKGYGTEATKLMVSHGFEALNLNRISLTVFDHNPRGIRAYEKAGFVKEGVLRQDRYVNGKYHNTIVMGILKEEWESTKKESGG
ncbi:MAG: GNAT family N-acetyltransferase [Thermodesulfobacteriota bacterium]